MQTARRFCAVDGNLCHLRRKAVGGQGSYGSAERFQRNGGNAQPGDWIFVQYGVYNSVHIALCAADEYSIRGGQRVQSFRGFALNQGQIVSSKFLPVLLDQCTGFRVTFYGIYLSGRGGKRQLHAHAAGARAHVP